MASRSYWAGRGSSERDRYQSHHRDGNSLSYTAYQGEQSSYHPSRNSASHHSVPHADPTGTYCTLCRDTLYTDYDVQTHLASPRHLDMVVQYPMIPLADVLVPAGSEREAYPDRKVGGKLATDKLESSYGSEALSDKKVRSVDCVGWVLRFVVSSWI